MQNRCEGKFEFNEYLLVVSDVLETETPVVIGGVEADILTPGSLKTSLVADGPDLPAPPSAVWKHSRTPGSHFREWGVARRQCEDITVLADISAAVLRVNVHLDDQKHIDDFSRGLVPWFSLLCEWLATSTGQNLLGIQTRGYSTPPVTLWGAGPDGTAQHAHGPITITGTYPDVARAITREKWRRALHQASEGNLLPVERQLIVEARAAIDRGALREAVIAAASAVEVALNTAIRAQLRPRNEQSVIESLMKNRALDRLKTLAATFNVYCPSGLQTNLIEVRNRAVHQGIIPSLAQAAEVLRLATEVVDAHCPLPW